MNRAPGKARIVLANLCWLLSSIPGWLAYLIAARRVKPTQLALLRRLLKSNATTEFGKAHKFEALSNVPDFQSLPLSEHEDYLVYLKEISSGKSAVLTKEPVELLQPTSGSTAASKLIPYTRSLRAEFKAAINPWIASLYLNNPSLLGGRHYWSISPATPCPEDASSKVRIGFADDAEYLGVIQRFLPRALFVAPPEISQVNDHEAFQYLTLLFLCRERNLRVISIWHPSFLTVLLRALPRHFSKIINDIKSGAICSELSLDSELRRTLTSHLAPDARRAEELSGIDASTPNGPAAIWPRLRLISCWTDGISEPWLTELKNYFPRAIIQGKGLTATEGIISFPFGKSGQNVCAIRSHFLEFIDTETSKVHCAWELEQGRVYSVVLTTGGGLFRYRLHDIVRVTGHYHQAPCLKFIARDNLVSDLVGEKLNSKHVEVGIRRVERQLDCRFRFAMLAPSGEDGNARYILYVQATEGLASDFQRVGQLLEAELNENYHYQHARNLSQLQHLKVFRIDENQDAGLIYRRHCQEKGVKLGEIKFNALSLDRTWSEEFYGMLMVANKI